MLLVLALLLLAGISGCLYLYVSKMLGMGKQKNIVVYVKDTGENSEDKFLKFCDAYSFTDREREVMKALLQTDESMQNLADRLFLSRTSLYRYIASLNEKTETKNRVGLLQFYLKWEE